MQTQQDKAIRFRQLHESSDTFVMPNPWDLGSARVLEALGFEALATTSSGFAQTLGRVDGQVLLEEKLEHCRQLAGATAVPVSADLENGFAEDPAGVADTIRQAAAVGLVGASVEDWSREQARIYDFNQAVERVAAAVEAARSLAFPFTLTARAELLIRGGNDRDDVLKRLQAFEAAGADVLYAPGLSTLEQVAEFTGALGKPLNVLAPFVRGASVADFAAAGARRISVGGALARVLFGGLMEAGREMQERGEFGWLRGLSASKGLDDLLSS